MGRRETKVVEEAEKGGCLHIRKRRADSKGAFVLPFTGDLERDSHGEGCMWLGEGSGVGQVRVGKCAERHLRWHSRLLTGFQV